MENTSGQGPAATVPAEIDKWNWGALLLNWIWGIGNRTPIAFLMFVPFVNFAMAFVLGAKGSAWAWRHKRWESVEHFRSVQRKWARWGLLSWAALIALWVGLMFTIMTGLRHSEPFQLAVETLETHEEARQMLGQPLSTGTPMGQFKTSGPRGEASFSFSVQGLRGKGTAHVEAVKELGQWKILGLALEEHGTGRRLDIVE